MLTIEKLAFSWQDEPVLQDINFSMGPNEIVALLGPNGAGKTTLIRCILGQLRPSHGEARAQQSRRLNGDTDAPLISWIPQRITFYPVLTVRQNLAEFARIMGISRAQVEGRVCAILALIGLEHRADDKAKTLSGGMQRMLNVGIGLVSNPDVLLIDEPTAGIDEAARERLYGVLATLKASGLSILMTTHDLEDVSRIATRVVVLADGRIRADGTVDELILQRFSGKREVDLQLHEKKTYSAGIESQLRDLGLENTGDGFWSGLVNTGEGELGKLYQLIERHEHLIDGFKLQKPNMQQFIRSMLNEQGSGK